jgi:hypothetical protein
MGAGAHALEQFSATTPGYRSGLAGVGAIPKPKVPKKRSPVVTEAEERRPLKA